MIKNFFYHGRSQMNALKFDFRVTIHSGLWAKCTQLWALNIMCYILRISLSNNISFLINLCIFPLKLDNSAGVTWSIQISARMHWLVSFQTQKVNAQIFTHHWKATNLKRGNCWLNPKRAGGRNPPPRHFLLYLSRLLFFRAETSWLFFFKPCARFKTIFFKNRTGGYDAALRNRALGPTKTWPKTDFQWKLHTNRVFFVFFGFRIHFHYVLSYLFGLFGVRTCVSILRHTSLPKNATFAWKNSEKPWLWRFLVIFVFLTWRHCGVIQGMFVLFLVPMDSGGS